MNSVAIPYSPGYVEAVRAWGAYAWNVRRRQLGWFLVFAGVDALIIWHGQHADWRVWLGTATLVVVGAYGLLPLAIRLTWAYKIHQLGIHELELGEDALVLSGTSLRLEFPWSLYDGFLESSRYFLLTRPNGLFSFIPKSPVITPDAVQRVRAFLERRLPKARLAEPESPALTPRMPTPIYLAVYILLVVWFVLEGLRVSAISIWAPLFGMFILDWLLTRDIRIQYLFTGFLMIAIFIYLGIRLTAPPEEYGQWKYRVYEVLGFLLAFAAYQAVLWRAVLRTCPAENEAAVD